MKKDKSSSDEPTLLQRVIYGSLAMPLSTIGLPVSIYLAPFYAGELGLPLALLGTAMFIARLGDVVTDPLIGMMSDRWRPGIGRRKIWIALGAIVMLIGVVKLFAPTSAIDLPYFIIWLSVVYLGFTMLYLPHEAWGAEISRTYKGRTRLTGTRQLFNLLGLIIATVVPAIILMRPDATAATVLGGMTVFMVVLLPISALLLLFFVPDITRPQAIERTQPWKESLKLLASNRPFATVAGVLLLANIGETFRITITLFFARDVIGVQNIGMIYVYYFVVALCSVPFWVWFGNRIGKHRALGTALGLLNVTMVFMIFLGQGQVAVFTILFLVKGFCFGSLQFLPSAMIADTIDLDTYRSGDRRQGVFFAISGLGSKIGMAIGQGLSLNLLAFVGFQSAGESGEAALGWLSFFYSILPALFIVPAMLMMFTYKLTPQEHARIKSEIERRDKERSVNEAVPSEQG